MNKIREDRYCIRAYEADTKKRLRLSSLLDYFQETAWKHAEELGVGVRGLGDKGCFWALSRLTLRMERYPLWGDEITVRTWPKGIDKLFALRDFLVLDSGSSVIAGATTAWIIVDAERRRPVRIEPYFGEVLLTRDRDAIAGVAEKIDPLSDPVSSRIFRAGYSSLDINRHMNNARYADWIADSLPLETLEGSAIRELTVNYLNEIGPGQEVEVSLCLPDGETTLLTGRSGDRENFRSRVRWENVN